MKKILVAFDAASFSNGALDYAFNFGKENSALIVGVFIEDLSYLGFANLLGEDYFAFDPFKKIGNNNLDLKEDKVSAGLLYSL